MKQGAAAEKSQGLHVELEASCSQFKTPCAGGTVGIESMDFGQALAKRVGQFGWLGFATQSLSGIQQDGHHWVYALQCHCKSLWSTRSTLRVGIAGRCNCLV